MSSALVDFIVCREALLSDVVYRHTKDACRLVSISQYELICAINVKHDEYVHTDTVKPSVKHSQCITCLIDT